MESRTGSSFIIKFLYTLTVIDPGAFCADDLHNRTYMPELQQESNSQENSLNTLNCLHKRCKRGTDDKLRNYMHGCRSPLNIYNDKIIRIISPLYAEQQYPAGFSCEWEIIGVKSCQPVVQCPVIDLRPSENCGNAGDYLRISDGLMGEKFLCSQAQSFTVPLRGRAGTYMYLEFRSANPTAFSRLYRGFECFIRCHNSDRLHTHLNQLPEGKVLKLENTRVCGRGFQEGVQRIVGGTAAVEDEFPWQAAVVAAKTRKPFCGAALINNRFLLTAAHCLIDNSTLDLKTTKAVESLSVILKGHILEANVKENVDPNEVPAGGKGNKPIPTSDANTGDQSQREIVQVIDKVIIHKLYYKFSDHDSDIALLRLKAPIDLKNENHPTPVCLPDPKDTFKDYNGQRGTATGWGKTHELANSTSMVLRKVELPIVPVEKCTAAYSSYLEITENMICAGFDKGGRDTCHGDSGGSFAIKDGGKWVQIGIVSFGRGCARKNLPGVLTHVANFMPWIYHHTEGSVWPRNE